MVGLGGFSFLGVVLLCRSMDSKVVGVLVGSGW